MTLEWGQCEDDPRLYAYADPRHTLFGVWMLDPLAQIHETRFRFDDTGGPVFRAWIGSGDWHRGRSPRCADLRDLEAAMQWAEKTLGIEP